MNKMPADIRAEQAVLGAMLVYSEEVVPIALSALKPQAFYLEKHQVIFKYFAEIFEESPAIDVIVLADRLRQTGDYEKIGGALYLNELMDQLVSPGNTEYHCKIINDKYILRYIMNVSQAMYKQAESGEFEPKEVMDKAESQIFTLSEHCIKQGFIPAKDYLELVEAKFESLINQKYPEGIIKTGYADLDNKLFGFHPGDVIILAARPSVGKTAFALNLAMKAAITGKKKVGFFTLEMSADDVMTRMISALGLINISQLKRGYLNKKEVARQYDRAARTLHKAPLYIDQTPKLNVLEMNAKARRLKREHGLDMLIIDYLQLMKPVDNKRNYSRENEVSDMSRDIKILAKELNIPILALAQLSRGPEQRNDGKPRLSDLRESGAIEQDADVVMFLYKDKKKQEGMLSSESMIDVIIAKHRNGETGIVPLLFMKSIQRFELPEKDEDLAAKDELDL